MIWVRRRGKKACVWLCGHGENDKTLIGVLEWEGCRREEEEEKERGRNEQSVTVEEEEQQKGRKTR
jgi:hypothetical protein